MKIAIIILLCVAVSVDCVSDAHKEKMKEAGDYCQANPITRVPDEWLDIKVLVRKADQAGPHILCRLQKLGSLNEDGDVDVPVFRKDLLEGFEDPVKVDKIVAKCARREPNWSAEKTAIEHFKCDCVSDEHKEKMKEVGDYCQANPNTRVPDEWLDMKVLVGKADQAGPHILCRLQKLGSLNEYGDVDVPVFRKNLLVAFEDPDKVDKIVAKCARREPNWSAEKTAIELSKCVKSFD